MRIALVLVSCVVLSSGCAEKLDGPKPVIPDPVAGAPLPVDPAIACRVQLTTEIAINGTGFSPMPVNVAHDPTIILPDVTLVHATDLFGGAGDGTAVLYEGTPDGGPNDERLRWESQERMFFEVAPALEMPDGTSGPLREGIWDVRVDNRNGHGDASAAAFVAVDKPSIADLQPGVLCIAQGDREVTWSGERFLGIEGRSPTAKVADGGPFAVTLTDTSCRDIAHAALDARACTQASMTLTPDSVADGFGASVLTNPETAACVTEESDEGLWIVPPPGLDRVDPPLICLDDGPRDVVLSGSTFIVINGTPPTVQVGTTTLDPGAIAPSECVALTSPSLTRAAMTVERCTRLTLTLTAADVSEGNPQISVTNPAPAGCVTSAADLLTIPPPLTITAAEPPAICRAAGGGGVIDVTVTGTGFLRVDGDDFDVTVAGSPATPTDISGCSPLDVNGMTVESCTSFTVSIDSDALPVGPVAIGVQNPPPADCAETSSTVFAIVDPPVVQAVEPSHICAEPGESFTVRGIGFGPTASVLVGGVAATSVDHVSSTELVATFGEALEPGTYEVTVDNGGGCSGSLPAAITVDPLPLVFFVDPPTLYNGIGIEVTIYTTGLAETAASVELVDAGGNAISIIGFTSPRRPNQILAPVPAGLAPGEYDVRVTSIWGCAGTLPGAVTVVDQLNLTVTAVDPSFASSTVPTAVTISGAAGPPAFEATPRVYLNPTGDSESGVATALRAVVYLSPTVLTAVVPDGLEPGVYDLIVVNLDGDVALKTAALTVTADEPPVISSVTPASLDHNAPQDAVITGVNFIPAGVSVEVDCKDPTTGAITTSPGAVKGAPTSTSVTATIRSDLFSAGTVCIVRLKNSDGAFFNYSAISIKEPSQNLFPWSETSQLSEARRAPGLAAARPTETSRYLYAIGGDAGNAASAKTSVEGTSVDAFGTLGAWTAQVHSLPSPRTLAGVTRVGRFVYVVGGDDGDGAVDTVLRAQVLDPLAGPEIFDLDAGLGTPEEPGMGEGLWYYRVAAVFPAGDASNPSGESLPGEVLNVQLPATPDGIVLTLHWTAVTGASGYRVYRSPTVDGDVDALDLLVEVAGGSTTEAVDDGGATSPADPLPSGSLGTWHVAATLGTPRKGLAVAAAPMPGTADSWVLYAFGGQDESGATLDSYELATATQLAGGGQTLSGFADGNDALSAARTDLVAWVVTRAESTLVTEGTVRVFVGTGRGSNGQTTGEIEAGLLGGGGNGDLGNFVATTSVSPDRAACGAGVANGYLFLFGGEKADLNAADSSAALTSPLPLLDNWNSLGPGSLEVRRAYAGTAQESAFFFIAGGRGASGPLRSVEQTVR